MNLLCNAWVFCGAEGGCGNAHTGISDFGRCELKYQAGYDYLVADSPAAHSRDGSWFSGVIYKEMPIQIEKDNAPGAAEHPHVSAAAAAESDGANYGRGAASPTEPVAAEPHVKPVQHTTISTAKQGMPPHALNSTMPATHMRQDVLEMLYAQSAAGEGGEDSAGGRAEALSEQPLRVGGSQSALSVSAAAASNSNPEEDQGVTPSLGLADALSSGACVTRRATFCMSKCLSQDSVLVSQRMNGCREHSEEIISLIIIYPSIRRIPCEFICVYLLIRKNCVCYLLIRR
jgi:hypothetical protein